MAKRKRTTVRAVKKRAPKKSRRPSTKPVSEVVRPSRLLEGKRVVIVGRKNWEFDPEYVHDFVNSLSGTIVSSVDETTDILFIGGGRKTKEQNKAEKLNQSGDAKIVFVRDVRELLIPGVSEDIAAYVRDPKLLKEARVFLKRNVFHWQDLILDGDDFSKAQIGFRSKEQLDLASISIQNCNFAKATLTNFSIGQYDDEVEDCCFDDAVFEDAFVTSPTRSSFKRVSGKLGIGRMNESVLQNAKLKTMRLFKSNDSEIINCSVDQFGTGYHLELNESKFHKIRIKKIKLSEFKSNRSTIKDVVIGGGAFGKGEFINSKFENVRFENIRSSTFSFAGCNLVNCTFSKCRDCVLDFVNAKVRDCQVDACKFNQVFATSKQAAGIEGIPNFIDVKQLKAIGELADTILASKAIAISVRGKYKGDASVSLKIELEHRYLELKYQSFQHESHRGDLKRIYCYECPTHKIVSGLVALFSQSKVGELDSSSLQTKSQQCPLRPKALKEQAIEALDSWREINDK